MKRIAALILGILLVLQFSSLQIYAQAADGQTSRKIVVFKSGVSNSLEQDAVLSKNGALKIKRLSLINACVVQVNNRIAAILQNDPAVLRVRDDIEVTALARPAKPTPVPAPEILPWGIDRIDAEKVTIDNTTTSGAIKVGVIDTGIDLNHPDLKSIIKGGINTITAGASFTDDNGHGTHVAGIIAAIDNDIGVVGVGANINLYSIKVLNKRGSGYLSDIIEGLQWAVANGIQVVNMSLGANVDDPDFKAAIIAAYDNGLTMVAAAGNDYAGPVSYPAAYPQVIAVSAVGSDNKIASFSNIGPAVDLAAPGVSIYSTYKGSTYSILSGTSMASPHVAGAAALALMVPALTDVNQDGKISPAEVLSRLQATAEKISPTDSNYASKYGAGLVDAEQVVK